MGDVREYDGTDYRCIQSHVTQADWTPTAVPALWAASVAPSEDWQTGVVYSVGDVVLYNGTQYTCLQAHTSQAGWTPTVVPALWSAV